MQSNVGFEAQAHVAGNISRQTWNIGFETQADAAGNIKIELT